MIPASFDPQAALKNEKRLRLRQRTRNLLPAAPFVLPGLILACVFVVYPMLFNIRISFSDYQIVQRTMTWVWSVDDTQTVAVAGGAADVRAGGELHPAAGDEGAVERGHPGAEAVHLHPAAVHGVVPRPRPHAESCVRAWWRTSTASATTPPSSSPSGS